jgi:hypothetical protein
MKTHLRIERLGTVVVLFAAAAAVSALACFPLSVDAALAAQATGRKSEPAQLQPALSDAARFVESVRSGRYDVPRVELAAWLLAAGFEATGEYRLMRQNAARELSGRPDGLGEVTADELHKADEAIAREVQILHGTAPRPTFPEIAKQPGRPQIEGLNIIYLNPLGDPAHANGWKNIIVHQTEGPPGGGRREADDQFANPTKRGVTIWVETDGTVYWSTAENVIPTHGEGGDRNDNKYIDNTKTYHAVVKTNSIGVEFVGNFPDVAKPVTPEQVKAWLLLMRFLQERYGIPSENIYAHNWIDFKDRRYCEGCDLATLARKINFQPSNRP